jgi:hypothetical protein
MATNKLQSLLKECHDSWDELDKCIKELEEKQKDYLDKKKIFGDRLVALTNEIAEMMPALMSTFILKKDLKVPSAETARKRRQRMSNMQKKNYSIATYLHHSIKTALSSTVKTPAPVNRLYRQLVLCLTKTMVAMFGATFSSIGECFKLFEDSTFYQERKEMMWVLVFSISHPPSIVLEPDFVVNPKVDISRNNPKFDVYDRRHANLELYWLDYVAQLFIPPGVDTTTFFNNPVFAEPYRKVIEEKNKSFVTGGDNLQQTTTRHEEEEQAKITSEEDEIANNEESKKRYMVEASMNEDEEEDEKEDVVEKVGESDCGEDEDTNDGNVVLKRQRIANNEESKKRYMVEAPKNEDEEEDEEEEVVEKVDESDRGEDVALQRQRTEHVDGERIARQSTRTKTKPIPFSECQDHFPSHKSNGSKKQTAVKVNDQDEDEDEDEDEVVAVMFNLSPVDALKEPTFPAVRNLELFCDQQFVGYKKECGRLLKNTKMEEEIPLNCFYWKISAEKVDGMRELATKFLLHITPEVDELEEKKQARFICNEFKKKMSQYKNPKKNGRFMSFLDIEWIKENIPEFMEVIYVIYGMFWNHNHHVSLGGLCVLKSYPDCGAQQFHLDYLKVKDDESMWFACNELLSFSLLFSLQDGTKIDLSSDGERLAETVQLSAGDLFIMNANLCHRGCNYDKLNYRLFFVAESRHMPFKSNKVDKVVDLA